MLGWELPPHNSGGLGVACYQMSKALASQGVDIDFVVPYSAKHPGIDYMNLHRSAANRYQRRTDQSGSGPRRFLVDSRKPADAGPKRRHRLRLIGRRKLRRRDPRF